MLPKAVQGMPWPLPTPLPRAAVGKQTPSRRHPAAPWAASPSPGPREAGSAVGPEAILSTPKSALNPRPTCCRPWLRWGSLCSPQSCGWMDRTRGDRRNVPRDAEGKVEGEITSNLTHKMKSATGRTVVCLPEERGRELTFCVCLLFVFKLH